MSVSLLVQLGLVVVLWDCANHFMLYDYGFELLLVMPVVEYAHNDPQATLQTADEFLVSEGRHHYSLSCSKLLFDLLLFSFQFRGQQLVVSGSRMLVAIHMTGMPDIMVNRVLSVMAWNRFRQSWCD